MATTCELPVDNISFKDENTSLSSAVFHKYAPENSFEDDFEKDRTERLFGKPASQLASSRFKVEMSNLLSSSNPPQKQSSKPSPPIKQKKQEKKREKQSPNIPNKQTQTPEKPGHKEFHRVPTAGTVHTVITTKTASSRSRSPRTKQNEWRWITEWEVQAEGKGNQHQSPAIRRKRSPKRTSMSRVILEAREPKELNIQKYHQQVWIGYENLDDLPERLAKERKQRLETLQLASHTSLIEREETPNQQQSPDAYGPNDDINSADSDSYDGEHNSRSHKRHSPKLPSNKNDPNSPRSPGALVLGQLKMGQFSEANDPNASMDEAGEEEEEMELDQNENAASKNGETGLVIDPLASDLAESMNLISPQSQHTPQKQTEPAFTSAIFDNDEAREAFLARFDNRHSPVLAPARSPRKRPQFNVTYCYQADDAKTSHSPF
ncbi:hypothetical protein BLNAU_756 [Blattamonas nauphoetae]|uniref:Uncharacterized protein n=1 Tax=Blattamonas nauphoetae TaxID=2049346 RepID=A0ABQ9YKE9_9EUKA|nr:hypothetical protein BLNAU_756 [Blattamonas nauphoetae]